MKKSFIAVMLVIVISFSVVSTFFVTTMVQVNIGDKVVINRSELNQYREVINRYSEVEELKKDILENYYLEVNDELLFEGMKKGIFAALNDPYSIYMNAEEFSSHQKAVSGRFPGIGIYLTPNDDNEIEIVAPIEDTPAYEAGLKAEDIIVGVNGTLYSGEQMDQAIAIIKGEPGTPVTLKIYRPSTKTTFDVEIIRAWIDTIVVKSRILEDEIGYLRLSMFDEGSAKEFKTHMDQLVSDGVKSVIIDLRGNPGGYLGQCIEIADSLLGKQLIAYTEGRNGDEEKFYSDADQYDVELVVLTDGGSGSASEILTGALKDHKAAIIVGTKTYGKGVVQVVTPFYNETGFKLTTSQYFTPGGYTIHKVGIEPDVFVEMNASYFELEVRTDADDNQLQKAIEVIKSNH